MRFWRVPAGIALGILLGVALFQYQFGGKKISIKAALPGECVPITMHDQSVYLGSDSAAKLPNIPHEWGVSPFFGYSCQGSNLPDACTSDEDQVIHFPFRSPGNGVAHINVVFDNFFSKLELEDGTLIAEMTTAGVVTLNDAVVVWPSSGATGNFTNINVGGINTSNNFGVTVAAGEHEFILTGKNFTGPFGATILSICGSPPPPNTCGDGVPGGVGEQCDDGNSINDDACSNACQGARCGDFITQPILGEACDDANTNDADGCNSQCQIVDIPGRCGDGISGNTAGEECDDGNNLSNDGCRGDCRNEDIDPKCVYSTLQEVGPQGCNYDGICRPYSQVCDFTAPQPTRIFNTSFTAPQPNAALNASCSILLRGQLDGFLGNIQVGNAQKFPCTTIADCPFGFSSNISCVLGSCYFGAYNAPLCQKTLVASFPVSYGSNQSLTASYKENNTVAFANMNATLRCCDVCGDGHLDLGEECDNGTSNSNAGSCTRSCKRASCGDGFRQPWGLDNNVNTTADNEECDPNAAPWNAAPKLGTCINTSPIICKEARCGDGLTQTLGKDGVAGGGDDEQCDDGDGSAASIAHSTGNNGSAGSSCSTSCQWINVCGNGRIDAGGPDGNSQTNPAENETCDDGVGVNVPFALANKPWLQLTDADIAMLSRSRCMDTCKIAQCSDAIDNDNNSAIDSNDGACIGNLTNPYIKGYNIEACPFCSRESPSEESAPPPVNNCPPPTSTISTNLSESPSEVSFFSRFIALLHVENWGSFLGSLLPSWFHADVPLQAILSRDSDEQCNPTSPNPINSSDALFCDPSQYCNSDAQCVDTTAGALWGGNCTLEEYNNCFNGGLVSSRDPTKQCLGQFTDIGGTQKRCEDGYRCAKATGSICTTGPTPMNPPSVYRCKKVSIDWMPNGNEPNSRCETYRDCGSNYKVSGDSTSVDDDTGVWNPDPTRPTLCIAFPGSTVAHCCNPNTGGCGRPYGGTAKPPACLIQPSIGDGSPPFPNTTGGSTGGTPGGTTGGTTATTGGTTGGGTSSAASSANSSANSSATSSRSSSASSSSRSSSAVSSSRSSSAISTSSSRSSSALSSSRSSSVISTSSSRSSSALSSSRSSSAISTSSSRSSSALFSSRSSTSSIPSSLSGVSSSSRSSSISSSVIFTSSSHSSSPSPLSSSRSSSVVSSAPSSAGSAVSSSRSSSATSVGSSTSSSALSSSRSSSAVSSAPSSVSSSISSSRSSSAISSSRSSSAISSASSISSSRSSSVISSSRSSSAVSSSRSSSVTTISSSRSSSFAMSSSRISGVASSSRSSSRFSSAPSSARYSSFANTSSASSRTSSLSSSIIIAGTTGGTNGGVTSGTTSGTDGGAVAGTTSGTNGGAFSSSTPIDIGPFCGNGAIESGEECDDSNIRDGDGCSSLCLSELGYCGNGKLEYGLGEQCDEGTENGLPNADCDANCEYVRRAECGDGIVDPLTELCDAGANNGNYAGAPCRENCILPRCGDGAIDTNEECDDGNNVAGDTCTADCRIQRRAPLDADLIGGTSSGEVPRIIPTPAHTQTGPGLVIFLVTGAAAGIGLVRRRLL